MCCGATTVCRWPSSRPNASSTDPQGGQAPGQAVRRLPGADDGATPHHLLHQRHRDLPLGRHALPAAPVDGFYTRDELHSPFSGAARKPLADVTIDDSIVERHYQRKAIRNVTAHFDDDHARAALLVMATGSGKTRTVIALADLLMRANWVKRVLFLADRKALVRQAANAKVAPARRHHRQPAHRENTDGASTSAPTRR